MGEKYNFCVKKYDIFFIFAKRKGLSHSVPSSICADKGAKRTLL